MIETEYQIHDNGGRPFTVKIAGNRVRIYKNDFDDEIEYTEPFFDEIVERVFVGESPKNEMTEFSAGHGDSFKGNSLLLCTSELEYVFIGEKVYSFSALSEIVQYVSPVGNSDVPYPYAIDIENRAYLMTENVIVQLTDEEVQNIPEFDPYGDCYYLKHVMTKDMGIIPPQEPIIKDFCNIKEFYVGNERYTMTYHPFPEKDYDRLIGWDEGEIAVILTTGVKKELSSLDYVGIINDWGNLVEFQPLETNIIHKRLW